MPSIDVPGWEDWSFDRDGYLRDPAGNKYLPRDLEVSFWMRQAWNDRAGGYPRKISFLHDHLRQLIRDASPPTFIVEIKRQSSGADPVVVQTIRLTG